MQSTNSASGGGMTSNWANLPVNVGSRERIISATLGAFIFTRGIRKLSLIKTLVGGYLMYRGASGHCPAYESLQRSKYTSTTESVNIKTTLVVNKPKQEVYDFWRKLENLPLFMRHLKSVKTIDDVKSHWVAKVPGNVARIQWDAEIVKDEEGSLLSWRSLEGATVMNAGKVEFRDLLGNRGTELNIMITYKPPAGQVGGGIAWLLNPLFKKMIEEDISNFKQYIETGFLPSIEV